MSSAGVAAPGGANPWGRAFVHPAFDTLLIGGGLSLGVAALFFVVPASRIVLSPTAFRVAPDIRVRRLRTSCSSRGQPWRVEPTFIE
ncbi:MAG: hypothetical protein V3T01_04320 [Myxococcota bacterium]